MKEKYANFIEQLENHYTWPSEYMFKFIVNRNKEKELIQIFEGDQVEAKESSKGNYVSITVTKMINNTEDVISIYEEAHQIEGVIAL